MKKLKVNVVAEGLTDKEQLKLEKAVDHFERAINSRQFLEFCNPYRRGGGYEYIKVRTVGRMTLEANNFLDQRVTDLENA